VPERLSLEAGHWRAAEHPQVPGDPGSGSIDPTSVQQDRWAARGTAVGGATTVYASGQGHGSPPDAPGRDFGAGAGRNQLTCVRSWSIRRPVGPGQRPRKEIPVMLEAQTTIVSLTEAAAGKLRELTKDETSPEIGLRVYVYSGGCSGYKYGMMLEDQPTADDNVLSANGVRVYIDNNSVPLISGSQIDYVDTLMGAGFTVNNPNATTGCGCGNSFRTADDEGQARSCAH
jgi:iron-sulfur cluster assembly accessory protein